MSQHKCLLSFCRELAPMQYAICRSHFDALPQAYNEAIRACYSVGSSRESASPPLMRAIANAEAWIHETFNSAPREKWERLKRTVAARDALRAARRDASPPPAEPTDPDRPPFRHLRLVP